MFPIHSKSIDRLEILMKTDKVCVILLLLCSLFFTGCYRGPKTVIQNGSISPGYPIVIENYDGYAGNGEVVRQVFYEAPDRIVATSEVTVDDLIFLGLEDKIVGIGDMTDRSHAPYDLIYQQLPRLNTFGTYPSREQVIAAQPDIIIGWGSLFQSNALGSVKEWHARGIHTYVMKNTVPTSATRERKVSYFLDDLENLSMIFNVLDKNKEKIDELRKRLRQVESWSQRIPEDVRPTVVTVQYVYGNTYFARTSNDLTADIIRLAGGRSLDGTLGSKQSIEFLLKENPDILLVIDTPKIRASKKIETMLQNPVLQNVNAVRNHRFLIIDQNAFYCGSIRTIEAIEELQKIIKNQITEERY